MLHHIYIPLYVGILKDVQSNDKLKLIIKYCDKHFNKLFNKELLNIENNMNNDNFYEKLCAENKNIDNIIGLSILITYLEKEKIILGYIEKVLDPFINTLDNANDTDVFKMLTSFYNISQLYYDKIPLKYMQTLQKIKNNTSSSKIKFKVMDILGE